MDAYRKKKVYLYAVHDSKEIEFVRDIKYADEVWLCVTEETEDTKRFIETCRSTQIPVIVRSFQNSLVPQNQPKRVSQPPLEMEMEAEE